MVPVNCKCNSRPKAVVKLPLQMLSTIALTGVLVKITRSAQLCNVDSCLNSSSLNMMNIWSVYSDCLKSENHLQTLNERENEGRRFHHSMYMRGMQSQIHPRLLGCEKAPFFLQVVAFMACFVACLSDFGKLRPQNTVSVRYNWTLHYSTILHTP